MEDYWGNIMDSYQRAWDIIEDDRELIIGYSKTFDSLQVNKTYEIMKTFTLIGLHLSSLDIYCYCFRVGHPVAIREYVQSSDCFRWNDRNSTLS